LDPVHVQLNLPFWELHMNDYPEPHRSEVLRGIAQGIQIPFNTGINPQPQSDRPQATCLQSDLAIARWVWEEVQAGRIRGPFRVKPQDMAISPMFVLRQVRPDTIKYRVISDFSYAPEGQLSINESIDLTNFPVELISVKTVAQAFLDAGEGCYAHSIDMAHSYRQIPVREANTKALGFKWKGRYYYHLVNTWGMNFAVYGFCLFSDAWIHICKNAEPNLLATLMAYIDDFFNVHPTREQSQLALDKLLKLCEQGGWELNLAKTVQPSQQLTILGVFYDSVSMTVGVDPKRKLRMETLLQEALTADTQAVAAVHSLVGKLQFLCQVVTTGQLRLRPLRAALQAADGRHNSRVRMRSAQIQRALQWWLATIKANPKLPMKWAVARNADRRGLKGDDSTFSDASGKIGFGAWWRDQFWQSRWVDTPYLAHTVSINVCELAAVAVSVLLWGASWRGFHIKLMVDNMVTMYLLNSRDAHNPIMARLLLVICEAAEAHEFFFSADYIGTKENVAADVLSRMIPTNPATLARFNLKRHRIPRFPNVVGLSKEKPTSRRR
jgi:hypothetical protein